MQNSVQTAITETAATPEVRKIITQPNGDITDAGGTQILDSFAYRHLRSWIEKYEARNDDEFDSVHDEMIGYLLGQSSEDRKYWQDRTWRDLLTNARFYSATTGTTEFCPISNED